MYSKVPTAVDACARGKINAWDRVLVPDTILIREWELAQIQPSASVNLI